MDSTIYHGFNHKLVLFKPVRNIKHNKLYPAADTVRTAPANLVGLPGRNGQKRFEPKIYERHDLFNSSIQSSI